MPKVMANWFIDTSLPRLCAGDISDMYIGPTTDVAPTARPESTRTIINSDDDMAKAQPSAEIMYKTAVAIITFFLPYFSVKFPVKRAPIKHPMVKSAATVPKPLLLSVNWPLIISTAPEIPAIFNPKSKPPFMATKVIQ